MPETVWMTIPVTTTFVDTVTVVSTTLVINQPNQSSACSLNDSRDECTTTSSLRGYRTTTSTPTHTSSIPTTSSTPATSSTPTTSLKPTSQLVLTSDTRPTSSFLTTTDSTTTDTTSTTSSSTTVPINTPTPSSISADAATLQNQWAQERQRHILIGSLCGAIAGLVIIGLALCLFLRRRRRQQSEERHPSFHSEKKNSPKASRHIDSDGGYGHWSPKPAVNSLSVPGNNASFATTNPRSGSSMTVDEGHHIIRESIQRWPRPYARGESLRDSVPAGALRVVNPDMSNSPPPIPCGYLKTRGSSGLKALVDRPKPAFIPSAAQQGRNSAASTVFSHYSDESNGNSRASIRSTTFQQHPLAQQIRIDSPSSASSSRRSVSPLSSDERLDFDHSHAVPPQHNNEPSSGPSPLQPQSAFLTAPLRQSNPKKPSLTSLRTVRQTPPEDPFYEPSATPISPDSIYQLSSPTWYSPPPSQARENRGLFSPAGENPSQSYREEHRHPEEESFSQRSSRYSQQISPVSPQHQQHQQQKQAYEEAPNWPLPSFSSFQNHGNPNTNMDNRGGTSSSEDSLGDPKGVGRSFTERDLIDEAHLAPPRPRGAAAAYAFRGDSWARRSDPFDLDRESRIL